MEVGPFLDCRHSAMSQLRQMYALKDLNAISNLLAMLLNPDMAGRKCMPQVLQSSCWADLRIASAV